MTEIPSFLNIQRFLNKTISRGAKSRQLVLSESEASELARDLETLLIYLAEMQAKVIELQVPASTPSEVDLDGGTF
tara:strand:+ start:1770 stop:1997 length:228 start_codon:yes stop_codon:yes gene_type:complete